MGSCGGL
jgi:hypothetical protein